MLKNNINFRYIVFSKAFFFIHIISQMSRIGHKYELIRQLGKGQFGAVCEAHCIRTHKQYAAKLEHQTVAFSTLKHEATILHHLNANKCTNIPYIYYYGQSSPYTTLVITFYEGSLENLRENMTLGEKIQWWNQMLKAFNTIHRAGIVHRDIKPPHFMKHPTKQEWHLIDFGLATSYIGPDQNHIEDVIKESIVGSPNYVSYFVHLGKDCVRRDDFISLIYVFWELLYGKLLNITFEDYSLYLKIHMATHEIPENERIAYMESFELTRIDHPYNDWLWQQKDWKRLYRWLDLCTEDKMKDFLYSVLMHAERLHFADKPNYESFEILIEDE